MLLNFNENKLFEEFFSLKNNSRTNPKDHF